MIVTRASCTANCVFYISCHDSGCGKSCCSYYGGLLNDIYNGSLHIDCGHYTPKA